MSKVNLYKIADRNHRAFLDFLEERRDFIENKQIEDEQGELIYFHYLK